jgi:hypothetical protein
VYILNRTITKGIDGKTPYELWTGSTPVVHHLRTFGCIAHVNVTKSNLKKLDDRSKKMTFVGYEPGSVAYRCYDPDTRKVHVSRDVIFYEDASWDWVRDEAAAGSIEVPLTDLSEDFQIIEAEPSALFYPGTVNGVDVGHNGDVVELHDEASNHGRTPSERHPSPASGGAMTPLFEASIQTRSPPSENLDADHDDDVPLRYSKLGTFLVQDLHLVKLLEILQSSCFLPMMKSQQLSDRLNK